jgi:hypothetical protein
VGQGLKPVAAPAPKGIYGGQPEGVAVIGRVHRFMGAVQAKGAFRRGERCWTRAFRDANQHEAQGKRGAWSAP